ncbi:CRISPR-associated endonuclease Cas2 [Microbulbifer thermotolerans]|uniref:CRISPR-associated endoribonuclease Cas2 n=1 Tax=Microbulbifer thermotolerans TaxID=252514 RepID=A0A143HPJ9_MICTH|nr:CRISPR-associated endonuclease Cas2 [Microbulbifer thermotolerans]AMX03643.1 CRISPR-associated protein Cas2 [Microbulbifer thermotolerans]MCX2796370.1 CRISPR-associated endonuclease Cas2 [Microbulbifer thermotolerans]MCX2802575.1 CRISPR-associated endonuclease Cas2 [Microbulbifer thermotolerans]SFD09675.1 CRISPR-associated protein Cas2 [Microbulbifer thermotolerans]
MSSRQLYIAAYDIRNPRRLRKALRLLKDFACGGQKSVFECYLTNGEKAELFERIAQVMDTDEDSFLVAPVPEGAAQVLGIGIPPADPQFYYVG